MKSLRLCVHNHAPKEVAVRLALDQQVADQLGGGDIGGSSEEGLSEHWQGFYGRTALDVVCVDLPRNAAALEMRAKKVVAIEIRDVRRAALSIAC